MKEEVFRAYGFDGEMVLAGRDRRDVLAYAHALASEHTMHVIVTVACAISASEWPIAEFWCDDVAAGTHARGAP